MIFYIAPTIGSIFARAELRRVFRPFDPTAGGAGERRCCQLSPFVPGAQVEGE